MQGCATPALLDWREVRMEEKLFKSGRDHRYSDVSDSSGTGFLGHRVAVQRKTTEDRIPMADTRKAQTAAVPRAA